MPAARPPAVLRDYPLLLWADQAQYSDALLREFSLLLIGERSGALRSAAPGRSSSSRTASPRSTALSCSR